MPSRTLAEALREHLACPHGLSISVVSGVVTMTHDRGTRRFLNMTIEDSDTAAGSSLFHECANRILADGEHTIVPLHITDEEYAGYLNG